MSEAADSASTKTPAQISSVYWLWLVGLGWTSLGVNLLSFGMVWTATAHSAWLAGLVLLATAVPRVALTLLGGAVADQWGPVRVMITADVIMATCTSAAAVTAHAVGPHPVLLIGAAFVLGVADAFYQPAAGAVPKLLVGQNGLPRAMAARQVVIYFASVLGPTLGGVVVSAQGLPLSFGLGAGGFAGMLLILLLVRRRMAGHNDDAPTAERKVLAQVRAGLALMWRTGLLRGIFLMTAAFAFFVLPMTTMLIPLISRSRGWGAEVAGTASGAFSLGMVMLALMVMWGSGARRAGLAAMTGMMLTGVGILGLAVACRPHIPNGRVLTSGDPGIGSGLPPPLRHWQRSSCRTGGRTVQHPYWPTVRRGDPGRLHRTSTVGDDSGTGGSDDARWPGDRCAG